MPWSKYVAIGDSFTEGMGDPGADGRDRGWADRLATGLATTLKTDDPTAEFFYSNLAIRGRKLPAIVDEQLSPALSMRPDLISIAGGVNDAMRPNWDIDAAASMLAVAVSTCRQTGADVLLVAFGDPSRRSLPMKLVKKRLGAYHEAVTAIAAENGCFLIDFWPTTVFDDPRFWADDRLHFGPLGHERASWAALEALGLPHGDWQLPLPPAEPGSAMATLTSNARWTAQHLTPWIKRRVQRKSSGDNITAKRPSLSPVNAGPVG